MKNIMLIILISLFTLSCAKTVKIDHEGETKSGMLEEVPKWFVEKEGNKISFTYMV